MEGKVKMVAIRATYGDGTVHQAWINPAHVVYVRPVKSDSIPEARSEIEFLRTTSTGVMFAQDTADEIASKIGC